MTTQVQSALVVYKENMSSEEAKKELVEAFILQAMSAKKLYRVSNANIVNKDGENVDVSQLINELTNPTTLETINSLLITNPNMVSAQNLKDLSSVLGYNTIKDNHFIPITKEALCYGLTNK